VSAWLSWLRGSQYITRIETTQVRTLAQFLVLAIKVVLILALVHAALPLVLPIVDVAAPVVVLNKVVLREAGPNDRAVLVLVDLIVDVGFVGLGSRRLT
jgi:hypothetical protein